MDRGEDDALMRQTFVDLMLGETYEGRGERVLNEERLLARCEVWPAEVPDGVAVITAGVDTG
jgi:phage terminase large subunit GpA-like protein